MPLIKVPEDDSSVSSPDLVRRAADQLISSALRLPHGIVQVIQAVKLVCIQVVE
ncbi:MAG: hypothetical protein ACLVE3_09595 [[Clostridium] scindens]